MATSFLYGMFGVSAAFAVFCLSYFLTSTPCNKVTELSTGQHALCRASASTGRIRVKSGDAHGATTYHLREEPHVLPGSGVAVWQNTTTKLPSAGLAARSFTMLPGSWLKYQVLAGIDSYFYITDYKGYANMRHGRSYKTFVGGGDKPARNFTGTFSRNETEKEGIVAYFVVENPEIKEREVTWSFEGLLTQYDVSDAVETCAKEECDFHDISPSSVVLTAVNATHMDDTAGHAVDSTVSIEQVTYYHGSTQTGWSVAGVVTFLAVLSFFVPGLHKINKQAREKNREQRELAKKKLNDEDYEDE